MTWNTTDEPIALYVPIDSLAPHPRNYNAHPAAQLTRLQASLREFGQPRPIVAHRGIILAGHGVWMAARAEGWRQIWASVVPDSWTEERALAYLVADNETRRGAEPDSEALAELVELARQEVDLSALGFDEADLQALLDSLVPDLPEPEEWGAALGGLPEGDRAPFQQMTFTLSDAQAEVVRQALAAAKEAGPFDATGNENSNGNALARIAEAYCG